MDICDQDRCLPGSTDQVPVLSYRHLRDEATVLAGGAMWGEPVEAMHLAGVAVAAIAPAYEEVLADRDEEILYLKGRVAELHARLNRIRWEASP